MTGDELEHLHAEAIANLDALDELHRLAVENLDELADLQAVTDAYADELADLIPMLRANYAESLADLRKKARGGRDVT